MGDGGDIGEQSAKRDPRIDAYIEASADFAQPILRHLRKLLHQTCPDLDETIKWSMPFVTLNGKNFANFAAFKHHAVFGFEGRISLEKYAQETAHADEAMGQFGRITSLDDLPTDDRLREMIGDTAKQMAASGGGAKGSGNAARNAPGKGKSKGIFWFLGSKLNQPIDFVFMF